MKNLITLLIFAFALQSCQNKTEKAESKSIIDTVKTKLSEEEQPIYKGKKDNLPFEIEGKYRFENEDAKCKIELTLFYENGQLKYKMQTNTRTFADNAKISQENGTYHITFQNIKWSENLGYIDPEGSTPEKKLPLPTEILATFRDNEIIFENYGNAENHFLILKECDTKYIFLTKQTNIQLGENVSEINAYAKNIYQKNGKTYIDLDFVEIRYPTEGEWDVSDREIINNNPKIRTYIIDDSTSILSNVCKEMTASELYQARKSLLKDKTIIVIGKSENGKMLSINFGCYG